MKKSMSFFNTILVASLLISSTTIKAQQSLGLKETIISFNKNDLYFPISSNGKIASIYYNSKEDIAVRRAVDDLQRDLKSVTNLQASILGSYNNYSDYQIIIGTWDNPDFLKEFPKLKSTAGRDLKGKWESFSISTNMESKKLFIIGSDRRGTIYGIYELSRQMGVSPWYWFNDVPIKRQDLVLLKPGYYISEEPKVKYRGIFINDEEPAFGTWARTKFGGINSDMYAHIFELLLRLRANYFWPAMWGKAFNEDDPLNPKVANDYGIIMGTSHHEPLMRSQKEWNTHRNTYGNGEWDYKSNKNGLLKFWEDGLRRNRKYDNLITMGMRGDGDEPMTDLGSAEANFKVLENIMEAQSNLIKKVMGKDANKVPKMWALYSEVLEYYDKGIKIPDDIIVLLCDDNWGNVRRLPQLNQKKHPGGYGMYYHVDLHGAPRAYQWLNMTQIPHMWEQLQLTYDYGVDKIWILNVGDLKPNEYPMDFFLNMAWNPKAFKQDNLTKYTEEFTRSHFGEENAKEAAEILNLYCKYSSRISAEMMDHRIYNLESGEFLNVRNEFLALEAKALRQYTTIGNSYKDTYKQIILHPVRAMANLYDMYYAVANNHFYYQNKDIKANYWADYVDACFKRDADYTEDYNLNISGGKWNHMMDQTHIGYTTWDEPKEGNIKPKTFRINDADIKNYGYVFSEKNGVVVMEAEHFFNTTTNPNVSWKVIPDLGRNLSGIALFPYTSNVDNSSISYKFNLKNNPKEVKVRLFFDSTLPFNEKGNSIKVNIDGLAEQLVHINQDLTWENNYSKMYPAGAARLVKKQIVLPLKSTELQHILTIKPQEPGTVLYKVVVDNGGYEETFLKLNESPYNK